MPEHQCVCVCVSICLSVCVRSVYSGRRSTPKSRSSRETREWTTCTTKRGVSKGRQACMFICLFIARVKPEQQSPQLRFCSHQPALSTFDHGSLTASTRTVVVRDVFHHVRHFCVSSRARQNTMCVCVCVFVPFILGAGLHLGCTSRGHTERTGHARAL